MNGEFRERNNSITIKTVSRALRGAIRLCCQSPTKKKLTKKALLLLYSPSKCSFTPSKLRFFGLRKPKNSSFYSTSPKRELEIFSDKSSTTRVSQRPINFIVCCRRSRCKRILTKSITVGESPAKKREPLIAILFVAI